MKTRYQFLKKRNQKKEMEYSTKACKSQEARWNIEKKVNNNFRAIVKSTVKESWKEQKKLWADKKGNTFGSKEKNPTERWW